MEKIRAVKMVPGEPAEEVYIHPAKETFYKELGGDFVSSSPRRDSIAIIAKKLRFDEVLQANRKAVSVTSGKDIVFCGTIFAVGRDIHTRRIRSLSDKEYSQVMIDYGKPFYKTIHDYGLKEGEELSILSNQSLYFEIRNPDCIKVIKEYRYFIVCEAIFDHVSRLYKYKFCINKSSILCGETRVKRLSDGKVLE